MGNKSWGATERSKAKDRTGRAYAELTTVKGKTLQGGDYRNFANAPCDMARSSE